MVTKIKFPDDLVEEARDEMHERSEISEEAVNQIVDKALMILDVWDPSARGKAPSGVAATAVYVAADTESVDRTELTQQELCDIFGSSPMTIRKQKGECLSTARDEGVIQ